jgi:hypothetical protein
MATGRDRGDVGVKAMREGFFEEVPGSENRRVFRLHWVPEQPLSEQERQYAQFVRYLITIGRLTEHGEAIRP